MVEPPKTPLFIRITQLEAVVAHLLLAAMAQRLLQHKPVTAALVRHRLFPAAA
jgi:hypothetical protein